MSGICTLHCVQDLHVHAATASAGWTAGMTSSAKLSGNVKYTHYAFNKTTVYKRKSRNHLGDQIESFRIGDKDNKREDDLLDTFCYGIALALGDGGGF
jgi:hypothetical protein